MADGSYNQILQLDWILVDINGDGREEYVLSGKQAGLTPPTSGYNVAPGLSGAEQPNASNNYYIEGQVYPGWDQVPPQYKVILDDPGDDSKRFNFLSIDMNPLKKN